MGDKQSSSSGSGLTVEQEDWGASGRGPRLLVAFGLAVTVVAASMVAFYRMYSTFPWYDDDGYLLITIHSFLSGHPLYDETYTSYGPFFYLWRFLIHGVLGVPITHDATRGVALFEWGLCGLFAALLLRRSTGNSLFSVAGGILVFLFLEPVTKEASHPQLLAMVVTLGAALAFTHPSFRRTSTFVAGLLVGALFAIKPNLGVFAGLGLVLVQARWIGGGLALTAASIAAIALPIVLLRAGFAEPTMVAYAAICALAALAQTLDRRRPRTSPGRSSKTLVSQSGLLFLGAGAAFLGASVFALSRGTTLAGLLDGVLIRPMKFASVFVGPAPFPPKTVVPAVLAALFALGIGRFKRAPNLATHGAAGLGLVVLGVVSIGYVATGCTLIEQGGQTRAFAGWLLALGTPWAFLFRSAPLGTGVNTPNPETVRVRETLIALAVTHMAIGFPAAGTQLACGASLFVLAALAAAYDALNYRVGEIVAARVTLGLALVAAVVPASFASRTYNKFTSIGLPGASLLRVDSALATQLQIATATLRTNGGPFVTVYGVNSLYLWTQLDPPTAANATLWPWMLNDTEQSAIVAILERDERSAVLVVSRGRYLLNEATNQILGRWIRDRTAASMEVGPGRWQFRRRVRDSAAP